MVKIKWICLVGFLLISFVGFGQDADRKGRIDVKEDVQIEELLSLKADLTKKNKLGGRYKIQLGSYRSMENAQKIKEEFEEEFSNFPVSLEYESPNYKVWVGDFTSRLAAERAFLKFKEDFKSSFIFKPKN